MVRSAAGKFCLETNGRFSGACGLHHTMSVLPF